MSIREQLRGVIRRSRDMADIAGENDDDEYSVLEAERRVSPRSGISPTGRSLQDLMKEQQSHMWAAEERHRKEYLPILGEAILAVGGDPNAPAKSGGSGAASYAHLSGNVSPSRRPSSSSALAKGGSGEGSGVGTPRTPHAGSRINPILNRSPSQSPESTSLGLMLMRPGGTLALAEVDESTTQHQPETVTETVYTYPNRSSLSNSASASGSGRRTSSPIASDPPPPPYNGASSEDETTRDHRRVVTFNTNNKSHLENKSVTTVEYTRMDNRQSHSMNMPTAATLSSGESERGCSPCVSYRSATPPPPKLLSTTPPPTPKGSFNNLRKAAEGPRVVSSESPSCSNDLQSADSTVSGPPCDDLDSTQTPNTHMTVNNTFAKSSETRHATAIVGDVKGGSGEGVVREGGSNHIPAHSTARTSSSPPSSPPPHRSPRAVSGGGGVLRPASGSSSASIGGTGPSMSLREMMLDRNKDLHDAERKRSEEYIPLRDAAIKEIEKLEAEGRWRSK